MRVRAAIKALGYGGSFVGEVIGSGGESDPRVGKKIFVREVAPGEIVDVEIVKEEPKFILGRLTTVVTSSPARTTPPCPKFGLCGGCDLQHLDISTQRAAKIEMVRTMLSVQGKIAPRDGVKLLGEDLPGFNYRRRIQLHLDRTGALGFYRANSTAVVPIERCHLALEPLNEAITALRPIASVLAPVIGGVVLERSSGKTVVVLVVREEIDRRRQSSAIESVVKQVAPRFPDLIIRRLTEALFRQRDGAPVEGPDPIDSVGHFSQVNAAGNEILIDTVRNQIAGAVVTDLFAGAGNFALPLARAGMSVTAVELDPALVLSGTRAAREEGIQVQYVPLPCEKFVERHPLSETVVLDPPRAGAKEVVKRFDPSVTKRVVYVSCDLPSLTRDLKTLVERGYIFERLFVVDMFPQTHHVETVAVLGAH